VDTEQLPDGWIPVFDEIVHKVDPISAAVYGVIFRLSLLEGGRGSCTASKGDIANMCCMSERTVIRHINKLIEKGYIVDNTPSVKNRPHELAFTDKFIPEFPASKSNNYLNYYDYIKSDKWKKRANDARRRANFHCQICNSSKNLHVHHRTYERLGNEKPTDLIVLCAECHKLFHDNKKINNIKEL